MANMAPAQPSSALERHVHWKSAENQGVDTAQDFRRRPQRNPRRAAWDGFRTFSETFKLPAQIPPCHLSAVRRTSDDAGNYCLGGIHQPDTVAELETEEEGIRWAKAKDAIEDKMMAKRMEKVSVNDKEAR